MSRRDDLSCAGKICSSSGLLRGQAAGASVFCGQRVLPLVAGNRRGVTTGSTPPPGKPGGELP
eukprot:3917567-Pyramimonas_sp.AAC.1